MPLHPGRDVLTVPGISRLTIGPQQKVGREDLSVKPVGPRPSRPDIRAVINVAFKEAADDEGARLGVEQRAIPGEPHHRLGPNGASHVRIAPEHIRLIPVRRVLREDRSDGDHAGDLTRPVEDMLEY